MVETSYRPIHRHGEKMLEAKASLKRWVATSKNLQQYSHIQEQVPLKRHPIDF